jgi:hypothetical protein
MKKTLYYLLLLSISLASCTKDNVKEAEPVTITTMGRVIHYTVTGARKDTVYTTNSKIVSQSGFTSFVSGTGNNTFYVSFDAGPHVDGAVGDFIQFRMDRSKLKEGYVGRYSNDAPAINPLDAVRYVYSVRDVSSIRSNIFDTDMGHHIQGELIIDHYDAAKKAISGAYNITATLIDDPTSFSYGRDPEEQCTLYITGTFSNVKVN